jgi:hypothetical protein
MRKVKVPVTQKALLQRLDRKLTKIGQALIKVRGEAASKFGYCITEKDEVVRHNVDLEKLGRDLAVLEPWETVVS